MDISENSLILKMNITNNSQNLQSLKELKNLKMRRNSITSLEHIYLPKFLQRLHLGFNKISKRFQIFRKLEILKFFQ